MFVILNKIICLHNNTTFLFIVMWSYNVCFVINEFGIYFVLVRVKKLELIR